MQPYIINGTPGHAEVYKWIPKNGENSLTKALNKVIPKSVAFGASIFPKGMSLPCRYFAVSSSNARSDVMFIPQWWAKCNVALNITYWKEHDVSGHFPSIERPAVLVADIRKFTKTVDPSDLQLMRKA